MAKKHVIVFLILAVLIILSAIYPIINFYADKTMPPIPQHHTYKEAVSKILPNAIKQKAEKVKYRGNVEPIQSVEGRLAQDFPSLKLDVITALAAYPGWNLRVSGGDKKKIKKHLEKRFREWGAFANQENFEKMLKTQAHSAFNTKYSASAVLTEIPQSESDNIKLTVTINDILTSSVVFNVTTTFVHPKTLEEWKTHREQKKEYLTELERRADISLSILAALLGILLLYLVVIFGSLLVERKKRKNYLKYLRSEISKRQQLVDDGHFVAALELAKKYLKEFPDDTEIVAFKNRLLDFTNNDPHKAQLAYVEAKKLEARIKMAKDNPMQSLLSDSEKKEIKALLPYNPALKDNYGKIASLEKTAQKRASIKNEIEEIKLLIKKGKLSQAEKDLELLLDDDLENVEVQNLMGKINEKKELANGLWKNLHAEIRGEENVDLGIRLNEILKIWNDMHEAKELAEKLKYSKNKRKFKIKTQKQEIQIYYGDEFILGREDEDVKPDIILDDKRVSRPHAKISLTEDAVIIEDLNSTGGTYINGEKIQDKRINNNDTLTIAKILDFTAFIYSYENKYHLMLRDENKEIVLLSGGIIFDIFNDKIKLGEGDSLLKYVDGVLLLLINNSIYLFFDGAEIILNNKRYKVEVIKE